jgi:hypothetical protein
MKPGYQTTEFWTAVAPIVGSLTVKDAANQDLLIICGACLAGLYIISRTIVKYKENSKNETVAGNGT